MAKNYDVIVIGGGPGGYVASIRASQLGMKVGLVEKEHLGGICLNWGCIPTKALLKSASVLNSIKHASRYGIKVDGVESDFEAIIKRSRNVALTMKSGVSFLLKKNKVDVINGVGKLEDNNTVIVETEGKKEKYSSQHIILATGGRPKSLPSLPIDETKIISYKKALSMEHLPSSMVIVGAGAIGVEFAYFYNSMGTKVTLIEYMPNVLPTEDDDIKREIEKEYKKLGIKVFTATEVLKVDKTEEECLVTIKNAEGEKVIASTLVLSAVGIESNTDNLGLEKLGIVKDKQGKINVDDYYATNVKNIYAIGDIIDTPALAHVASAEGIVCVEKIAGKKLLPINYNNIPACVYCEPEVASVGYTEKEAKEKGYDILVGKFPFTASGKATASGKRGGFIKVVFDKKYGEWLGAHFIGTNVTEMIAEVVVAKNLETTGHEIIKSIHPHPTLSEAIMEAVAAAYKEVIHL